MAESNKDQPDQPLRVIVIDDEPGLRDMLSFGLGKRGYRVVTAVNGDDGLQKARCENFDLAICDIMMAGKSGVEVLAELKKIQPDMHVIMATGHATLETAIETMKRGAFDYITKPYGVAQLCAIFDKAIEHRRLQRRVNQLEELDRLKSEFLSNTSHELRTPLNAVMGFVSLLVNKVYGALSAEQLEVLQRTQASAKHLLNLITNLLDLSQIAAGRMETFVESCELAPLVKDATSQLQLLADEKRLAIQVDVPSGIAMTTDAVKLKQIVLNLLANAIKFTPEGRITVRGERMPDSPFIRLSVEDTGIGIQKEDFSFLFQEFRQLDASRTRTHGGAGLGLSIAKRFAELLGGRIEVASTPGKGSVFTVYLPVQVPQSANGPAPARPPLQVVHATASPAEHPVVPEPPLVLLVEDDANNRRMMQDALELSGHRVQAVATGAVALQMASQKVPDIVVLDLALPGIDGWEVARRLRANPPTARIKIIAYSAHAGPGDADKARQAGCDDYIPKPAEPAEVVRKVAQYLPAPAKAAA